MKRIFSTIFTVCLSLSMMAQGWPANYGGVMLQGFPGIHTMIASGHALKVKHLKLQNISI